MSVGAAIITKIVPSLSSTTLNVLTIKKFHRFRFKEKNPDIVSYCFSVISGRKNFEPVPCTRSSTLRRFIKPQSAMSKEVTPIKKTRQVPSRKMSQINRTYLTRSASKLASEKNIISLYLTRSRTKGIADYDKLTPNKYAMKKGSNASSLNSTLSTSKYQAQSIPSSIDSVKNNNNAECYDLGNNTGSLKLNLNQGEKFDMEYDMDSRSDVPSSAHQNLYRLNRTPLFTDGARTRRKTECKYTPGQELCDFSCANSVDGLEETNKENCTLSSRRTRWNLRHQRSQQKPRRFPQIVDRSNPNAGCSNLSRSNAITSTQCLANFPPKGSANGNKRFLLKKKNTKLQAERLKKLRNRFVEQDCDATLDSISQISVLSPTNTSILNANESDSQARLMELLKQNNLKSWNETFSESQTADMTKIGEGVYGEVFQVGGETGDVIKIFPIEGNQSIMDGTRSQMTFHTVFPEVFVSKKLTGLAHSKRNRTCSFTQLKRATLVEGKLPLDFIVQWKVYNNFYGSDNICLEHLPCNQLWMVLEYEFGGTSISKYRFANYLQVRSVMEQLALTIAAAEKELLFEHRDLHWGNVLVQATKLEKLRYKVDGVNYVVQTHGVRAAIIDFTVSRMCYNGHTVHVDLSENPDIFEVYDGSYQNEIYRIMQKINNNDWRSYFPVSNVLWYHYLCIQALYDLYVISRGDINYEPVYSELVALEQELRYMLKPPDSVLPRGVLPLNCRSRNQRTANYGSLADLVSNNFFFDSCRMSI